MKRTALLALLSVAVLAAVREASPSRSLPKVLVVSDRLLDDLRVLAGGMQNELILCLGGRVRGDTAILDRWRMPRIQESTPVSARLAGETCDPRRDLATWHNHPTGACTQLTALRMGSPVAGNLCHLSSTDIQSALAHPTAFQIVHSGRDTWCWWSLSEVTALAEAGSAMGRPARGREVGVSSSLLSETVR